MTLCFGKKPARAGAVKLKFESFFSPSVLPTPPLVFGRPNLIPSWGMFANDRVSDCVLAEAAHETMLWNAVIGNPIPLFDDENVISDYSACAGYDPNDPDSDQGTDMQVAAKYRQNIGIVSADRVRHRIDSYVALRRGDLDQIALATYLFGAVGLGLQMPQSAMTQFDNAEPWSPVNGSPNDGGHCVNCCGRNSHGNFLIVTWGRLQAVTPEFLTEYMDEGICYLTSDWLTESPRGFDKDALRAAMKHL
jgi:hypothetical protein